MTLLISFIALLALAALGVSITAFNTSKDAEALAYQAVRDAAEAYFATVGVKEDLREQASHLQAEADHHLKVHKIFSDKLKSHANPIVHQDHKECFCHLCDPPTPGDPAHD